MNNSNFNEEIENELNALGLGGKCIPISDNDKGTPDDYVKLESSVLLRTEENRKMMEKSISYSKKSLPVG